MDKIIPENTVNMAVRRKCERLKIPLAYTLMKNEKKKQKKTHPL